MSSPLSSRGRAACGGALASAVTNFPKVVDVARFQHSSAVIRAVHETVQAEQRILAVSLSRDDALHLKAKPNSPALRTLRLYYDTDDRLLEVSDSIHPGERFSYSMTIRKSR